MAWLMIHPWSQQVNMIISRMKMMRIVGGWMHQGSSDPSSTRNGSGRHNTIGTGTGIEN
jgi:hypothetical protein